MKKKNQSITKLLLFLGVFSFSISLFDNFRELWLSSNNINAVSISRIITFSSIVTVLCLLFFSVKASTKKLKDAMLITLVLNIVTSIILILFNNTSHHFFIKFTMFFDIAFTEIIFMSIYPLIMSIVKNDEIFTKREVIESISNKIGLLIASFLLGKCLGNFIINYNTLLILSTIFLFIAFVILFSINIGGKASEKINFKDTKKYFQKSKMIIPYLTLMFFSSMTWSSILGLKMLSLTEKINLTTKFSSYLILTIGVITNILAILIVKYLKFKNDYLNAFFKYGLRLILYFLVFLTNSPIILLITFIYLLLTDVTYNFVFSGFIINNLEEKYILIFNVIKYSISLIGSAIGTLICGLTFNLEIKYIGLATAIIGTITYILSNNLIRIKNKLDAPKN